MDIESTCTTDLVGESCLVCHSIAMYFTFNIEISHVAKEVDINDRFSW